MRIFGIKKNNSSYFLADTLKNTIYAIESDSNNKIMAVSPALLDRLGYSLAELQVAGGAFFHAEDSSASVPADHHALTPGKTVTRDLCCQDKQGRDIWLKVTSVPNRDHHGQVITVVQYAVDITALKQRELDATAQLQALDRSQAIIEFDMDCNVLTTNRNFLDVMGYSLDEIKGQPHRLFVDPALHGLPAYADFLNALKGGRFQSGAFKRITKSGREVWLQASYNPIIGANGQPYKIVKYALDVTAQKVIDADYAGQITAINLSQAVIEFDTDFKILTANQNFLTTLGYSLEEIKGRAHSMLVDPAYRDSADYREFRRNLTSGKFHAGEFKRQSKDGRDVWLQASYNPIRGLDGKIFKIVKYAVDVTERIEARLRGERVSKMIQGNLGHIDDAIAEATRQSVNASSASQQTAANVQAVAAGAEELNASVREISASMSQSRTAAEQAFEQVVSVDQATQHLTSSADAMLGIVDLIKGIAGQINLLALNATIESARAGEAGRGFAVVATEVKNLATQASSATERIAENINTMRVTSGDVVSVLTGIRRSITTVREYVTTTASAVEEQSAVTQQISENMQTAACAVQGINDNIESIARAADNAHESTRKVREAADSLAS